MKTVIRKHMFETNSSSTHTIVCTGSDASTNNGKVHFRLSDYNDKALIPGRRYDWTQEWITSPTEKLLYLLCYAYANCSYHIDDVSSGRDELDVINERVNQVPDDDADQCWKDLYELVDFVCQYNSEPCHGVEFYIEDWDIGVDHQSQYGSLERFYQYNNVDSLYDFIFNDNVWLRITNDNEEDEELAKYRPDDYDEY